MQMLRKKNLRNGPGGPSPGHQKLAFFQVLALDAGIPACFTATNLASFSDSEGFSKRTQSEMDVSSEMQQLLASN